MGIDFDYSILTPEYIYSLYDALWNYYKNIDNIDSYPHLYLYTEFQKELGISDNEIVSYGSINPNLIDPYKLTLFKIKYGI